MDVPVIDTLYNDLRELISHLESVGEISLRSTADSNLRKALLLAAASYFESRISMDIIAFVEEAAAPNQLVSQFVKNKAVSRQFHTYFNWDGNNANQFFALFGDSFRKFMQEQIKADTELESAVKAFLELGAERNRLVHQDFGSYSLEKTSEEIYRLYTTALVFVNAVPLKLRECSAQVT